MFNSAFVREVWILVRLPDGQQSRFYMEVDQRVLEAETRIRNVYGLAGGMIARNGIAMHEQSRLGVSMNGQLVFANAVAINVLHRPDVCLPAA